MNKPGKRDILLCLVVLAVAGIGYLLLTLSGIGKGAEAIVTVDGEVYGRYALDEPQEIPIVIDGVTANVLAIEDQKADMVSASCPDKLCVQQKAIANTNETIVCLPHKVVISIDNSANTDDDAPDAVVK